MTTGRIPERRRPAAVGPRDTSADPRAATPTAAGRRRSGYIYCVVAASLSANAAIVRA
jgi:hypothetical protein